MSQREREMDKRAGRQEMQRGEISERIVDEKEQENNLKLKHLMFTLKLIDY